MIDIPVLLDLYFHIPSFILCYLSIAYLHLVFNMVFVSRFGFTICSNPLRLIACRALQLQRNQLYVNNLLTTLSDLWII
jgi:hypothetical protein